MKESATRYATALQSFASSKPKNSPPEVKRRSPQFPNYNATTDDALARPADPDKKRRVDLQHQRCELFTRSTILANK
jgi:hypothetical protein